MRSFLILETRVLILDTGDANFSNPRFGQLLRREIMLIVCILCVSVFALDNSESYI